MKTIVCFLFLQLIYVLCSTEVQSEINNGTLPLVQDASNQQEYIFAILRELTSMLVQQEVEVRQLQKESKGKEMK